MNRYPAIIVLVAVLTGLILFFGFTQSTTGQGRPKLVKAKDGSGIIGYKDTPILPWCGYHVHDPDRPAPKKVTPAPPQGGIWDRGNNGVMLMGLFEIQVYDSYTEKLYPDGQAASVYGQSPPLVNACRKPGQWQSFDIVFFAPVFEDGKLVKPAYVTVLHNGVLVHHNQEIYGPTGHRILPRYDKPIPEKQPLSLSAHNNPVRFRNIWIRPL